MRPLGEIAGSELLWVRPRRTRREYELRAGDEIVATIALVRGSTARAESAGARYRFSREGCMRPRITVRSDPGEALLALFAPRRGGGGLTFVDGSQEPVYTWKKPRVFTNEHVWVDEAGTELVRFSPSSWGSTVKMVIQAAGAAMPTTLPLLVLLGEYLVLLAAQDAADSVAAVAPVVSGA
jgi:hypothetical protein